MDLQLAIWAEGVVVGAFSHFTGKPRGRKRRRCNSGVFLDSLWHWLLRTILLSTPQTQKPKCLRGSPTLHVIKQEVFYLLFSEQCSECVTKIYFLVVCSLWFLLSVEVILFVCGSLDFTELPFCVFFFKISIQLINIKYYWFLRYGSVLCNTQYSFQHRPSPKSITELPHSSIPLSSSNPQFSYSSPSFLKTNTLN